MNPKDHPIRWYLPPKTIESTQLEELITSYLGHINDGHNVQIGVFPASTVYLIRHSRATAGKYDVEVQKLILTEGVRAGGFYNGEGIIAHDESPIMAFMIVCNALLHRDAKETLAKDEEALAKAEEALARHVEKVAKVKAERVELTEEEWKEEYGETEEELARVKEEFAKRKETLAKRFCN